MTANRKLVVGLIGGIGSGKSMVASEFQRHGACVISGDALGHEGLQQPAIRDAVLGRWGPGALAADGQVNRRWLAGRVFANADERRELERLLFPWIEQRLVEEKAKAANDPTVAVLVLDAAVMLEAGWDRYCDRIVYVHAPRAQRLRRLLEQRGWTVKEVQAREQAQYPLTVKVTRADEVIDNSGPPEATARQVASLLQAWGLPLREPQTAGVGLP